MINPSASTDIRRHRWTGIGRLAAVSLGATLAAASLVGLSSTIGGAAAPDTVCSSASSGGSSGWCGLGPGHANSNTRVQGMVSVSSDGQTIVVNTQDTVSGNAPRTSFVCMVSSPASLVTGRLQETRCGAAGGVWLTFTGGSLTIDLSQYGPFQNAQFTIQVAANPDAANANGDSFYANFGVSTSSSGPPA